jgi:uncharacterized protein YuzE
MKVSYSKEVDVLIITMSDGKIAESDEIKPGIILDFDENGNLLRLEILNASKKEITPNQVLYEIL